MIVVYNLLMRNVLYMCSLSPFICDIGFIEDLPLIPANKSVAHFHF